MPSYTHGHHESVLRSHRWRTVENSAAYLLGHLRPGLSLLDIGCGPGTITADFAARLAPGQVLGIDASADVIAAATRDFPEVAFATGDVYQLDDADASWDIVHAHQVLQHLHDPVAALKAMRRVVRPGGIVAARDSDYASFTWHPADDGRDRHYTWSVAVDPADPELWYVSASRGPYAAHGRGDPQAGVYRRRNGSWDVLAGGLPDPLPAMPYALVADGERLFAGLANGELWETRDRGDTWSRCELLGEKLTRLVALAAA